MQATIEFGKGVQTAHRVIECVSITRNESTVTLQVEALAKGNEAEVYAVFHYLNNNNPLRLMTFEKDAEAIEFMHDLVAPYQSGIDAATACLEGGA